VAWGAFPVLLGVPLGVAIVLIERGGSPVAVVLGILVVAPLVIAGAEQLFPYQREWTRSHGDLRTDIIHALVTGVGTQRVVLPLVQVGAVVVAGILSRTIGLPAWPTAWPLVAQLALALVVAEFFQYWLHRCEHEWNPLWRFHATHHSASRLYWLNAARFHPGDIGLLYAVGYFPLIALGCPEPALALFSLFDAVFGMLQHTNIDVRLGPLNWVFSMAEPHRWHHSRRLEEANSNYGSNLIVWDLVFGTFFLPRNARPPTAIGIADMPAFPAAYLAQLASPFRWAALQREAGAATARGVPTPEPRGLA
jgi:sterol desaturase/sphingolipid hydroxylase (fatty acid hydroxylase superfamily)